MSKKLKMPLSYQIVPYIFFCCCSCKLVNKQSLSCSGYPFNHTPSPLIKKSWVHPCFIQNHIKFLSSCHLWCFLVNIDTPLWVSLPIIKHMLNLYPVTIFTTQCLTHASPFLSSTIHLILMFTPSYVHYSLSTSQHSQFTIYFPPLFYPTQALILPHSPPLLYLLSIQPIHYHSPSTYPIYLLLYPYLIFSKYPQPPFVASRV